MAGYTQSSTMLDGDGMGSSTGCIWVMGVVSTRKKDGEVMVRPKLNDIQDNKNKKRLCRVAGS